MLKKLACLGLIASIAPALALSAPAFAEEATQWRVDQSDSECRAVATNPPENVESAAFTASLRFSSLDFFATLRETPELDAAHSLHFMAAEQEPLLKLEAEAEPTYSPAARLGVHAAIGPEQRNRLRQSTPPLTALQFMKGAEQIAAMPIAEWRAVESALSSCVDAAADIRKDERPDGITSADAPYAPVPRNRFKAQVQYPSRALREGISGWVRVRLDVDILGFPTGCTIVETSGSEHFEREGCKMQRRAQFYTARNAADEPVAGSWETTLRFELPE